MDLNKRVCLRQYLQDDDGDDGHLRAEPREETLQLTTLANQVTVHYDGNQPHSFHHRLNTHTYTSTFSILYSVGIFKGVRA